MLKLNLPKEPYWLQLPAQVRIKVKPLTSAIMHMAQTQALREMVAIKTEREQRLEAGASIHDLPDISNDEVRHCLSETLLIKALAVHAIMEWENVRKSGSELPAELNTQNISELMDIWFMNQDFGKQYTRQLELLETEGNGSRPAANGTSAAGRNTAGHARKRNSPAAGAKPAL